MSDET